MERYNEIIQRIKNRREQLGFSYQDLADKTGLSKSTLQRYETGSIKNLPLNRLEDLANALHVSAAYLMGWEEVDLPTNTIKIPILGSVPAGTPVEAVQDILGYVEIDAQLGVTGKFFALKIAGDSMSPKIDDGDVVIVRKQSELESGEVGVVYVNGYHATCKKIIKNEGGIILQPLNTSHEPKAFTWKETETLPVVILGKVIESRRFF